MSIVQAPQTSSRHPLSHTGVVVCTPPVVIGLAAMYCRHEMMFMFGRCGTANSSQRGGLLGPSWRRMRMITRRVVSSGAPAVASVVVGFMCLMLGKCARRDKVRGGEGEGVTR